MFNLVNTELTPSKYLFQLVMEVRKERDELKKKASGKVVSCVLIHTLTFKGGEEIESAKLQYSMADVDRDGVKPAEYHSVELSDGGNYQFEYLTGLISSAAEHCNMLIDSFAMNGEVMYKDDIVSSINEFILDNLTALYVYDGYSVQTSVVAGGITDITITVA